MNRSAFYPIVAAVAAAVVDENTVSEIRTSVEQVGRMTSPGFVFSVPIGMGVTPQDPTLFASVVGPGLDLIVGALSPSGFDQFQSAQQAFIGFDTWASDIQKYAATVSSPKSSVSSGQSGPSGESADSYSGESSTNFPGWSDTNNGGFSYDSALPGGNETPDTSGSSFAPDQSLETDMMPEVVIGGEFGAENEARAEAEAQSLAADPSPYSEQESQAAEAAADQASGSNENDDRDDDDDSDDGDDGEED